MKVLVSRGANINVIDKNNQTPIFYSINNGNLVAVKLFLPKVKNINLQNGKGDTCLTLAAYSGFVSIVKVLLAQGAEKKIKAKYGDNTIINIHTEPEYE